MAKEIIARLNNRIMDLVKRLSMHEARKMASRTGADENDYAAKHWKTFVPVAKHILSLIRELPIEAYSVYPNLPTDLMWRAVIDQQIEKYK